MEILLAGASGALGRALRTRLLADGHVVRRLVRGDAAAPDEHHWDPARGLLDPALVEAADAVVNLGGSPLIGNPHSATYRREVRQSRVDTTTTVARAIAATDTKPTLIAANGIAYYGDRGEEILDEHAGSRGDHLLTQVTRDWQAATEPASEAGARVCILRTPPVMDRRSGALKAMLPAFRLGLGGPLGSGRQWFPIVSLDDWVAAVTHLLANEQSSGPYNIVMPEPTTNKEFTRTLARLLHRPALLRVPAFAIEKAAGPLAPELLGSVRAVPAKLTAEGFRFSHPDVEAVLRAALARE